MSFSDYCKNVSIKLNIKFKPQEPYKLCDLKPFYGAIHADLLHNYDFWGFADVDVVWGNLKSFYPADFKLKYDVFSSHNDRLSGHFCLLRNISKYVNLCFHIANWQSKLESSQHYALDETDFSYLIFSSADIQRFYRKVMMSILGWKRAWEIYYTVFPIFHFLCGMSRKRLYFKEQHTSPILSPDGKLYKYEADTWFYINGKLINNRNNREYMYLHFLSFKKNRVRDTYYWKNNYYQLTNNYDFKNGVVISKVGFNQI